MWGKYSFAIYHYFYHCLGHRHVCELHFRAGTSFCILLRFSVKSHLTVYSLHLYTYCISFYYTNAWGHLNNSSFLFRVSLQKINFLTLAMVAPSIGLLSESSVYSLYTVVYHTKAKTLATAWGRLLIIQRQKRWPSAFTVYSIIQKYKGENVDDSIWPR